MAQLVEIENVWGGVSFFCPVCGAEVFSETGEPAPAPCEHVLFSWIDVVGEYYNQAANFQQSLRRAEEEHDFEPSPSDEEFLEMFPDNVVLFAFTSLGMACGPVSTTAVHGIQFPFVED